MESDPDKMTPYERSFTSAGPSDEYVAMLRGEITAEEYVAALRERVRRETLDEFPPRRERRKEMNRGKLYATIERTARTFVQGFLGIVTADAFNGGLNATLAESLEVGALAGAYAVLMAFAFPPRASAAPEE
jgi:hypothetical protein